MRPDHGHESIQIIFVSKVTSHGDEWMAAFGGVRYSVVSGIRRSSACADEKAVQGAAKGADGLLSFHVCGPLALGPNIFLAAPIHPGSKVITVV